MKEELESPVVSAESRAMELISVWIIDKKPTCVITSNLWSDPSAWGLLMADVIRHLGNAYAIEGRDREEVIARIKHVFDIEWNNPTSDTK